MERSEVVEGEKRSSGVKGYREIGEGIGNEGFRVEEELMGKEEGRIGN